MVEVVSGLRAAEERARIGARARAKKKRRDRTGVAFLFLSPWMAGAVLLTIGPILASLYLSFTDYNLFSAPNWVGLRNYVDMFTRDDRFRSAIWVTLKYVVLSVPLKLAAALGVALLLHRLRSGQGFYRSAFYAPSLLGASVSVALAWRALFGTNGAVDHGLGLIGVHSGGWTGKPQYALLSIVLLSVWQFGAPMVIFLAGLKQIPQEYYDAAAVDGAGRWRTFVSITLPMLSPVLLFNDVISATFI